MVPPPSQAGKFKPRKPPKKIKTPGAATAASAAASAAEPASTSSTRSRGRGGGGGRGGRGRGGRKRSPIALPRGAVYFTGNQTTPGTSTSTTLSSTGRSTAKGSSSGSKPATGTRQTKAAKGSISQQGEKESGEVVVGELDVAIGSTNEKPKALESTTTNRENDDYDVDVSASSKPSAVPISAIQFYDSDSSVEEQTRSTKKQLGSNSLPPTQLPFPMAPVQGQNNKSRAMYACQLDGETTEPQHQDPLLTSPFSSFDFDRQQAQDDSWFLVQFPTRMPPLAHANAEGPQVVTSDGGPQPDPVLSASSATTPSTPNTVSQAFDDSFRGASAGKLGKILVYKSGKTVLVMGGEGTSSPEIRMNVSEGLSCGFVQQAVAIDTNEGNYVPLGDVKKTIVVTPDVERAFPSS